MSNPLEKLARQYGNIILYDGNQTPSIYVPFYAMKSSELNASLPDRAHPAFFQGGEQQKSVLIGKYKQAEIEENGTLYALPYMPPRTAITHKSALTRTIAFGNGATMLTIADHGLMVLLAQKHHWSPKGNTAYGCDIGDMDYWRYPVQYTPGVQRTFRGTAYECIESHTSSAETTPISAPALWKRMYRLGGIPVGGTQYAAENYGQGYHTLSGSGGSTWYLGENESNLCDAIGNAFEYLQGVRLVNGEIQIKDPFAYDYTEDNDIASESDSGWKAIKPTSGGNHALVAPGTAGTMKYNYLNNAITLDTVSTGLGTTTRKTDFKNVQVNVTNVPSVPSILYELGLVPMPGCTVGGALQVTGSNGVAVGMRGGYYAGGGDCGIAALAFIYGAAGERLLNGARARAAGGTH